MHAHTDSLFDLGKRERQIVEAVYRRGEASVSTVMAELPDPPSYSAVRAMLGMLVQKGVLSFRREGKRYLYRAVASKEKAQKSVLRRLLANLFGGRASDAMVALLDVAGESLTDEDFAHLRKLIDQARKQG
ncbi:MAG: BlaI/MecI/CopY family transcriptional regulator [Pirellulales bacterium]|nr:BlaI/MecI/CopY family transcriptional regulator [Pirellulales bacterium]